MVTVVRPDDGIDLIRILARLAPPLSRRSTVTIGDLKIVGRDLAVAPLALPTASAATKPKGRSMRLKKLTKVATASSKGHEGEAKRREKSRLIDPEKTAYSAKYAEEARQIVVDTREMDRLQLLHRVTGWVAAQAFLDFRMSRFERYQEVIAQLEEKLFNRKTIESLTFPDQFLLWRHLHAVQHKTLELYEELALDPDHQFEAQRLRDSLRLLQNAQARRVEMQTDPLDQISLMIGNLRATGKLTIDEATAIMNSVPERFSGRTTMDNAAAAKTGDGTSKP